MLQREVAALIQQATDDAVTIVGWQDRQPHIDLALAIFEPQAPILRLERVGLQPGMGLEVTRNTLQRLYGQRGNATHDAVHTKADGTAADKGVDVNVGGVAVNGRAKNGTCQFDGVVVASQATRGQQVDHLCLDSTFPRRLCEQPGLAGVNLFG